MHGQLPSVRFPAFKNAWKVQRLGEFFTSSRAKGRDGMPTLSVTVNRGVIDRDAIVRKTETNLGADQHLLVREGDIAYNMMRMWQGAFGRSNREGIVSPAYVVLRPLASADSGYFEHAFRRPRSVYLFWAFSYGLTDDRLRLYSNDFLRIPLAVPTLPEQGKIAEFLAAVDERIAQLSQKKSLLVAYKQGVTQQLFAQVIRFKDYRGKDFPGWEDRCIGDLFENRSERGFADADLLTVSMNRGVYRQSDGSKKDNSNSDKSNYKRVEEGDIAYNSMRMWQGASAVSDLRGIVSPAYTILKGNEHESSKFFGYLFKTPRMVHTFQRYSQGLTSDTWTLKYAAIARIRVLRPSLQEQIKIATFLTALDRKIEAVATQISHTQTWKKGLLQQMFV